MPFSISFDFDELTEKVSNIQVNSEGVSKIKSRTKTSKVNKIIDERPLLEVVDNKLIFSEALVKELDLKVGERVNINYWTVDEKTTIPLVGKSEYFTDILAGNKLTTNNTVSFRGVQRNVLLEYGTLFTIKPWKDNVYQLKPVKELISADNEINTEFQNDRQDLQDIDVELSKFVDSEDLDLPF